LPSPVHLGNFALMENHPADQLDIVGPHPQLPEADLPDHREGLDQELVQALTLGHPFLKLHRLRGQAGVVEFLHRRFQEVDPVDQRPNLLEDPIVLAPENLSQYLANHINTAPLRTAPSAFF
jgi:hypothetical protein